MPRMYPAPLDVVLGRLEMGLDWTIKVLLQLRADGRLKDIDLGPLEAIQQVLSQGVAYEITDHGRAELAEAKTEAEV